MEESSDAKAPFSPPPQAVAELADACRRFVKNALGVELDYQPETLSLLDHYLEQARTATALRPEALNLLARSVGAYFGEVVRRRHASWWQTEGDDPAYWQIQFEEVYLAFSPVALVHEGLMRGEEPEGAREEGESPLSQLEIDDGDRPAVAARLSELPPVSDAEFYAPSTRIEVIDIAVEAIRARRLSEDEPDAHLTPDDYEGFPVLH